MATGDRYQTRTNGLTLDPPASGRTGVGDSNHQLKNAYRMAGVTARRHHPDDTFSDRFRHQSLLEGDENAQDAGKSLAGAVTALNGRRHRLARSAVDTPNNVPGDVDPVQTFA